MAATWTGPPSRVPAAASPPDGSGRPPPDPLDDATYEFPPAHADPYAYARFAGHLPALRLPAPRPGGLLTRFTARQALVVWSVVDLWAFATALRLGPGPLAPVALAGVVATCWHLRAASRERTPATRTTNALESRTRRPRARWVSPRRDAGSVSANRSHLHTTFSPHRAARHRRPVIGTRRASDWLPSSLSPAVLMAAGSVVRGAVVHAALTGAGPLH